MATKSKILIVGGTGYVGKFMVEASAKAGHPTYVLVRDSTLSNHSKSHIINNFKSLGVYFISGDLHDHESLVKAIKDVEVVISTVGHNQLADQYTLISAIKEVGHVKRFLPSEFGNDVDRVRSVEPAKSAYAAKAQIRRALEASGIPYTIVSSNFFADWFLSSLVQPQPPTPPIPPRDNVVIIGDGNPKAISTRKRHCTYTIRAVDDPRTLNKILYVRPPKNIYSFNDLVTLWENKIGKTLHNYYVPEDQVLKNISVTEYPLNMRLSLYHSVFVKGAYLF
ncbi:phenylcoumaran benzylic ether reductase Pyrc5-like [Benincasa hispida]|uniref:phenylcoumaran benzylic ether reductase Pyrc5-like n=1 Tax=Benincasa hispida TaxID=102211 RepID=UPI0018FF7E4E|nr:phenylcoumaran benzylic ether reductase Pyrc5-like [Benincasa hispida]